MRLIDANLIEEIFKEQGYDYCAGVVYCTPTIDIDSIIAEHENIGYEKGFRDGYAEAVDAEPTRHGRWIGKPTAGYSTVRCSVCRDVFLENNGKWEYCPHCGARMDEVEE